MVFAPFIGVNHHKQSVTFGAGLLSNERAETFVWLFKKFLDAMNANQLGAVGTNQDPAMTSAIKQVCNKSKHRFCMWHKRSFRKS